MLEREERNAPRKGWRYTFGVFARLLSVPLIFAATGLTFLLARSLYAFSLAMSENLGQVFAFFALFGAIGFFTKLGFSQLKKHVVALLRDLWNYFKSIFSRDPAIFGESVRILARRLIPVFILTIVAGLLSGYAGPPEAESGIPGAIEVNYIDGDVAVAFRRSDGQEDIANIVGLRGVISEIIAEALEEREETETIERMRNNYVASFPVLFERARLDSGSRAGAEVGAGPEFAAGAVYDKNLNRDLIRLLVESLAPCGEEDGTRPVWLSVQGYASSAPFRDGRGEALPQSRELNVGLANMRRRSVESALRTAIDRADAERRIRMTPGIDYTLHSQLERDRKFNDRPGAYPPRAGSLPQDFLTRVAYVNVLSAAKCAPDLTGVYP